MVDSCRVCASCRSGLEQYCAGRVLAYNAIGRDGERTYGGYSEKIVVDERFVVRIPESIPLANAAPLFCAGITLYSPLRHWKAGPGKRVAIVGFGGLGHVGVQIAKALGAHTTVLELTAAKREDALRLGADAYAVVSEPVHIHRARPIRSTSSSPRFRRTSTSTPISACLRSTGRSST